MALSTPLTRRVGIAHPIVQAPMAGGGDTPALAAAVSAAGGLGFLGAAYLTPAQIEQAAAQVRARTPQPFGINLFAPTPIAPQPPWSAAASALAGYHAELGLPAPTLGDHGVPDFDAQLAAALATDALAISFVFGIPDAAALAAVKAQGRVLIGTATTVEEAQMWERAGADLIVAQGAEAGGHRGSFAVPFEQGLIGTLALVPQTVDAVRVPVLAAGGVMDGRGLAAALALGAAGVQMGTAFLACDESGIGGAYRQALAAAREDATRLTQAFSGRAARGIANQMLKDLAGRADAILPFPWQNTLTRPLRRAAAEQGHAEFLSLWAGQGLRLLRPGKAADLVTRVMGEAEALLRPRA